MECYITYCIKGFLAFSEDFELITQKLFPKESIVTALMEIENKKIVSQEKEIMLKRDRLAVHGYRSDVEFPVS